MLSLEELLILLGFQGNEEDRIAGFVRVADKGNKGYITAEEVVNFFKDGGRSMNDPKERAKMMFKMTDLNSDGYIDKEELKKFFSDMAGEEDEDDNTMVNMMMAMMDKDEDGKLNFEEF